MCASPSLHPIGPLCQQVATTQQLRRTTISPLHPNHEQSPLELNCSCQWLSVVTHQQASNNVEHNSCVSLCDSGRSGVTKYSEEQSTRHHCHTFYLFLSLSFSFLFPFLFAYLCYNFVSVEFAVEKHTTFIMSSSNVSGTPTSGNLISLSSQQATDDTTDPPRAFINWSALSGLLAQAISEHVRAVM